MNLIFYFPPQFVYFPYHVLPTIQKNLTTILKQPLSIKINTPVRICSVSVLSSGI